MNRITRLLVLITALTVLASACGGADDEAAEAPSTTEAPVASNAEDDGESTETGDARRHRQLRRPRRRPPPRPPNHRHPPTAFWSPPRGCLVGSLTASSSRTTTVSLRCCGRRVPPSATRRCHRHNHRPGTRTRLSRHDALHRSRRHRHSWPYDFPIGVSGTWDLFPQAVEVLATENQTYKDITRELIAEFGIDDPDPQLLQVLRVDLEGDGVDEVLVVAERLQAGGLAGAQAGDYSIVYLRKVIGNEVQQLVLHHSTLQNLAPDEFGYLEAFRVPTVADLDGDGQMEIVTQGFYYEGSWTEMWEYVENGQGEAVVALSVGCGV